jgi:hypothetical protein
MKMKYVIAAPIVFGLLVYLLWSQTQSTKQGRNPNLTVPAQFAGTNPEHGKPGHRCDLAVGAPLPVGVQSAASSPLQASPQISVNPTAAPASTPGSPAINPAHGEPGHRCDIAVGAPLTASNAGSAAAGSAPPSTQVFTPQAPANSVAAPSSPKPKINPAHGQPWHRCDLQVGAPLT